jgi:MFS family permease
MALAIPYGLLADRIGRKPILALGVFTIVVNEAWFRVISMFRYVQSH